MGKKFAAAKYIFNDDNNSTLECGYVDVFPLNISSLYFIKFGSNRRLLLRNIRAENDCF